MGEVINSAVGKPLKIIVLGGHDMAVEQLIKILQKEDPSLLGENPQIQISRSMFSPIVTSTSQDPSCPISQKGIDLAFVDERLEPIKEIVSTIRANNPQAPIIGILPKNNLSNMIIKPYKTGTASDEFLTRLINTLSDRSSHGRLFNRGSVLMKGQLFQTLSENIIGDLEPKRKRKLGRVRDEFLDIVLVK